MFPCFRFRKSGSWNVPSSSDGAKRKSARASSRESAISPPIINNNNNRILHDVDESKAEAYFDTNKNSEAVLNNDFDGYEQVSENGNIISASRSNSTKKNSSIASCASVEKASDAALETVIKDGDVLEEAKIPPHVTNKHAELVLEIPEPPSELKHHHGLSITENISTNSVQEIINEIENHERHPSAESDEILRGDVEVNFINESGPDDDNTNASKNTAIIQPIKKIELNNDEESAVQNTTDLKKIENGYFVNGREEKNIPISNQRDEKSVILTESSIGEIIQEVPKQGSSKFKKRNEKSVVEVDATVRESFATFEKWNEKLSTENVEEIAHEEIPKEIIVSKTSSTVQTVLLPIKEVHASRVEIIQHEDHDEESEFVAAIKDASEDEQVNQKDVLKIESHREETSTQSDVEVETESVKDLNARRRSGLAGHATNVEKHDVNSTKIVKHLKEKGDENLIKSAISSNDFLRNLFEGQRLQAAVDAMYYREVKAKEIIIREGSVGTQLYISATGAYEVSINGKSIAQFKDNRVFGELAILYDAKRQATIRALSSGHIWVLDQNVYQQLMLRSEIEHHDELLNFLRNVPKLNTVSKQVLGRVADLLKREFFGTGTVIVRQGDRGDKFYIIGAGNVTVTKDGEGEVGKMCRGEFFGQLALLNDDVRQATVSADAPGVECFSLSRSEFIEHFGNVQNIEDIPESPKRKSTAPIDNPYQDVNLLDLERVGTLGVGGFGRVELVQSKTRKDLTFALKYLKKIDMIQQQQQEHAYNEKLIQMSSDSMFIVRMYKTFKDNKYLYFLMEPCLGGDLWSLLQKQKGRRFEESASRFYAASVLEALAYLHERNVVYRDLKPENLLLDTRGYLKLTDFGFAKKLGPRGKTYTFAGTPEYVTPEIILNRGHDRAVDYWALGIFIFELLVGRTPFRSNDTSYMKTYNLILRGIENVRFPEIVPRKAENLIKKLCRSMSTERLGCQKDGAQAVRDHKWFIGLEWNQLRSCQLKAPFKRTVDSNVDIRNFDKYEKDTDIPPEELSGWDSNF